MDLNNLKKQMAAVNNLIKLSEKSKELHDTGNLDSLITYADWLGDLAAGADDNDPQSTEKLMDQLIRVAPNLVKFIEHCIEVNKALEDEMEGNANDIFIIDDSFFNIDGIDNRDDDGTNK